MIPRARTQILSLLAGYAVAGLFWGSFTASLPALQARADLSEGGFGIALGAMALAALPVMRVFGGWLHRIETWAMPGALIAFSLGALALGFGPGLPGLLAAFVLCGAASGALDISLNNRTARVEAATGHSLFNRAHALFPAAMLAASATTGAVRDVGLPIWAIFSVVAAGLVTVALIERGVDRHVTPGADEASDAPRARLRGVIALLALIAAAGAFQEAAVSGWIAIYVERIRDAGAFLAGVSAAAFTLGLSAGRLGAHALETRFRPSVTVRLAALVALPAFLVIAMDVSLWLTMLACFIAGVGVGPIEPAVFRAVATRSSGAERGRSLAAVTAVAYLGYLISPPALGLVAEHIGWPALWGTAAMLAASVAVMASRVPRATG